LPFVRHLAPTKQNSLIAVQNTSSGPANITLNLYDPGGNLVAAPTTNGVAPLATAYFDTGTLFPAGTFLGSAEISAGGTIALAGSEQTRYLKDTASFQALTPADEGSTLYVGFVERQRNTAGVPLRWTELYARNDGSSPTDIRLQFYSAAGVLMSAASKTRTQVPPKGLAQFLTNAAEFSLLTKTTTYFKGWAVLTSGNSPQPLSLYALSARSSGTQLFGTSGFAATGTQFACGDLLRYSSPAQNSTLNLVNTGGTAATVTVQLYKPTTGGGAGKKTLAVGAHRLVSLVLTDSAFAGAGTTFEGLGVVTSSGPPLLVSVFSPYGSGGLTSYNCLRLR
jgi:hypothetical protein